MATVEVENRMPNASEFEVSSDPQDNDQQGDKLVKQREQRKVEVGLVKYNRQRQTSLVTTAWRPPGMNSMRPN